LVIAMMNGRGRLAMSMCAVTALAVPAAAQVDQPPAEMYFNEAAAIPTGAEGSGRDQRQEPV